MAQVGFARLGVDEHAKHFAARPAGQHHIPAKPQRLAIHRQPEKPRVGRAVERRRAKLPALLRAGRRPRDFGDLVRAHIFTDVFRGTGDRLPRGNGGRGPERRAARVAAIGRLLGPGHKLAGESRQFTEARRVRDQHPLEHIKAVQPLLPDHGVKSVMRAGEFALDGGVGQHLRAVAEKLTVLAEKSLGGALRIVGSEAREAGRRDAAPHPIASAQETVRRGDPFGRAAHRIERDFRFGHAGLELGQGRAMPRVGGADGGADLGATVEVGQLRQFAFLKTRRAGQPAQEPGQHEQAGKALSVSVFHSLPFLA